MALLTAFDCLTDIQTLYEGLGPQGSEPGWPSLDRHYRVMEGQWTLVHGIPGHGKSTFMDAMVVNLAKGPDHWHTVLFSPENYPTARHMTRLIEKWTGKPFRKGRLARMDKDELMAGVNAIEHAFAWIDPTPEAGVVHDLQWILGQAAGHINEHRAAAAGEPQRYGVLIDPWNEIESYRPPAGLSETDWIGQQLMVIRDFAKTMACHVWVVAHPAKMYRDRNGERPVPTPYDVANSAHFFNKSDCALCIWRDVKDDKRLVDIHIQKIRFQECGRVGMVTLKLDAATGCYEELKAL